MDLIALIFKLISKFIVFEDDGQYVRLKNKAEKWKQDHENDPKYKRFFDVNDNWMFQVAMCFVALAAVKFITHWLTTPFSDHDDDDDDDDDKNDKILHLLEKMQRKENVGFRI